MTLLDANILLYAYNVDAPQHQAARRWIEDLFSGSEWVGLPWITLWGFLRISTNPRVYPRPLTAGEAFGIVHGWLALDKVVVVQPGPRHAELLERLATVNRATGPLLTDAVLAALALEHGAVLASTDLDFSRFRELQWLNPLE